MMDKAGIRPEVVCAINRLAQAYHIEQVVLFGSRARGDHR